MKGLIWFLCILANALITVLIKESGFILGAIPTVILYGATFGLARTLCKKWDEKRTGAKTSAGSVASAASKTKNKCEMCDAVVSNLVYCKIEDDYGTRYRSLCADCVEKYNATVLKVEQNLSQSQLVETPTTPVRFCRKCGDKLLEDSRFCSKCGTQLQEVDALEGNNG